MNNTHIISTNDKESKPLIENEEQLTDACAREALKKPWFWNPCGHTKGGTLFDRVEKL
jgi:hypothetical protein